MREARRRETSGNGQLKGYKRLQKRMINDKRKGKKSETGKRKKWKCKGEVGVERKKDVERKEEDG